MERFEAGEISSVEAVYNGIEVGSGDFGNWAEMPRFAGDLANNITETRSGAISADRVGPLPRTRRQGTSWPYIRTRSREAASPA